MKRFGLALILAWALAGISHGDVITWTNTASGYWTNGTCWAGGVVPGPLDDVFITNGAATITINQDVTVSSLTVTGTYAGIITFPTGVVANLTVSNNFYLRTNATIQTTFSSLAGQGTGRTITVFGDARIDGMIDGTGCGFLKNASTPGGPGFGMAWSAAHGGLGTGAGPVYGSVTQPVSLGSANYNGNGGGAVKLVVSGTLVVNGSISMDAENSSYAAAGGSVWIDCGTLAGNGSIRANSVGGASYAAGGGRISLLYAAKTFAGSVSVKGTGAAQPGSLWEPGLFTNGAATITLNNAQYQYFFPATATQYIWGLTVTNGANVYFHDFTNGVLTLTNLVVAGGSVLRFDVDAAGRLLQRAINQVGMSGSSVSVAGLSKLALSAQSYTCSTFNVSAGSIVYSSMGDTNAINAASGGSTGSRHGTGITLICDQATIDGLIEASFTGFRATTGPGGATKQWDGGSYGGLGGGQSSAPTAPCYGSLTKPTALGSGARYDTTLLHFAGGAVKLVATNGLSINGAIRADGGFSGGEGGDSGGSIWLVAGALSGTGVVSAVGGKGNTGASHGAGGGGRIAVEYVSSTFTGKLTATNGPSASSSYPARTGTLFQCRSPYPGACSSGFGGLQFDSAYSVSSNGARIVRNVTIWEPSVPRVVWTDTSTDSFSNQLNNTATYTLSGMPINKGLEILTNNVQMMITNSGPAGTLTLTVPLKGPCTVSVAAGGMGISQSLPPTNVTISSACLNGALTSTGWYDTVAMVYWGPTDGGIEAAAWSNVCVFPTALSAGAISTNVTLPATGEYFYRYIASNEAGVAWSDHSEYLVSGVTIGRAPASIGERTESASFWVSRGLTATSRAITVSFLVSGTATNPADYTLSPSSTITLGTGASSNVVQLVSVPDGVTEADETVTLTLASTPDSIYGIATPDTATLTILDTPPLQISWINSSSGYWTNGANWSGGVVPTSMDDALITDGSATITINQNVSVRNLSLSGTYAGILTFTTGVVANLTVNNNLYVRNGAAIQSTFSSLVGNGTGRTITVLGDATIDGTIDAGGCGFLRNDTNPGWQGPGLLYNWSTCHGGLGIGTPPVYGSFLQPTSLGTGNWNGRGGGAVKLAVTGTLTVNGTITADSDNSTYAPAGGSIWVDCGTLAGNGAIHADALGGSVFAGGGGRISLMSTTKTYTGSISVKGSPGAQPGSLWDPALFTNGSAEITLNNAQYQYFFSSATSNRTWGLTVTNGANVYFHDFTNGVLTLTNLVVAGGSTLRFDVDTACNLQRGGINQLGMPYTPVSVAGSSILALPSLSYTCSTFTVAKGSTVYLGMGDTNAINAESGGTAGKRHGIGAVFMCDSAAIDGTLDASRAGFLAPFGPGAAPLQWDGGSYGGQGGGQNSAAAPVYGLLARPTALGSGGMHDSPTHFAGGAVKLVAANGLTINGAIRADGGYSDYNGDSGGSIWLVAGALSGTGTVSAVGGRGNLGGSHGGGGGGRIAVDYVSSTFTGPITVAPGAALNPAYPSRTGTLFRCQSPYLGTSSMGYGGLRLDSAYSVNGNGVVVTRATAQWRPDRFEWTDTSTDFASNPVSNVATYAVSGLPPNTKFDVYNNGAWATNGLSTADGRLTNIVVTLDAPRTIRIQGPLSGTLILVR